MDPKLAEIMAKRRQQLEDDEGLEGGGFTYQPNREQTRSNAGSPPGVPEQAAPERRSEEAQARDFEAKGTVASPDVSLPSLPTAGVGITLTEQHPFKVVSLKTGGPAALCKIIKVDDQLVSVDGQEVGSNLMGTEVVSMVVGPENSEVELEFRRSQRHLFCTRLVRQSRQSTDVNGDQAADSTIIADQGDAIASSGVMTFTSTPVKIYKDDFDIHQDKAEQAIKHAYDPETAAWERTLINVVVEPIHFAEGSLRRAYHMKDLSVIGDDSRYVLKMSQDPDECTSAYFNDVQMQIEAKMYADLYNANHPPKKVSFLDAYVLELKDRPGRPICAVEKFIDGEYKKYNNNWSWSDEQRNTPQAFSHFTYEKSGRTLLVCDIQGVGDLWTDPQIHSIKEDAYGKGNLGQQGIDKFLESHKCNEICRWLKLDASARVKRVRTGLHVQQDQGAACAMPAPQMRGICSICRHPVFEDQERARSAEGAYMHTACLPTTAGRGPSAVGLVPWLDGEGQSMADTGQAGGQGERAKGNGPHRRLVDQMLKDKDEATREKQELARQNLALEAELARMRAQVSGTENVGKVAAGCREEKGSSGQEVGNVSLVKKLAPLGFTAARIEEAVRQHKTTDVDFLLTAMLQESANVGNSPRQEAAVSRLRDMGFTIAQIESAQAACCTEGSLRTCADANALSKLLTNKILDLKRQEAEERASMDAVRALQEQEHRDALIHFHLQDREVGGNLPAAERRQHEPRAVDSRGSVAAGAPAGDMTRAGNFDANTSPQKPGFLSRLFPRRKSAGAGGDVTQDVGGTNSHTASGRPPVNSPSQQDSSPLAEQDAWQAGSPSSRLRLAESPVPQHASLPSAHFAQNGVQMSMQQHAWMTNQHAHLHLQHQQFQQHPQQQQVLQQLHWQHLRHSRAQVQHGRRR